MFIMINGNNGQPLSGLDQSFKDFVTGSVIKIGGVPIPNYVWYACFIVALMWFIWNKTTFGKNMFALGANEEAARVSGVNVFLTTILVFALAGAMYGWTGFVEGARVGSNTANTGLNYELDAIAAVILGGTSFVGGIGTITGTLVGALIIATLNNGMTLMGVSYFWQLVIKGAVIIIAVLIDKYRTRHHQSA